MLLELGLPWSSTRHRSLGHNAVPMLVVEEGDEDEDWRQKDVEYQRAGAGTDGRHPRRQHLLSEIWRRDVILPATDSVRDIFCDLMGNHRSTPRLHLPNIDA